MTPLVRISRDLSRAVDRLSFEAPVAFTYNPLAYARPAHERYLSRFGEGGPRDTLFLGMNPGPFGMAQTGVPFGDVGMVRDFLGITGALVRPPVQHPQRPLLGFDCPRSEVSGTRFWGWVRDRHEVPEAFFSWAFVANWCPLVFMESSGRNLTPDKLPPASRGPLFEACDLALARLVETLRPRRVIGVGAFAEQRARKALPGADVTIGSILHPSPASPAANRGWAEAVDAQLLVLGVPTGRAPAGWPRP